MKKILFLLMIMLGLTASAQVGIGTTSPRGVLDVVGDGTSALIVPSVATVGDVVNQDIATDPIPNGAMVYDETDDCIKSYNAGAWSACFGAGGDPTRTVRTISTTGPSFILPSDDILIYTGSGPGNFIFPAGQPLGKEFIVINNSANNSLLNIQTDATLGSIQLSAEAGTTIINLGTEYAALHSF